MGRLMYPNEDPISMQRLEDASPEWWKQFESLLDEQMEWPSSYMFKFIVPQEGVEKVKSALHEELASAADAEIEDDLLSASGQQDGQAEQHLRVRSSSKGNYKSVTLEKKVASSQEVIALYKSVRGIDGVIAL